MSSRAPAAFTTEEYLALERASTRKHELVDGAIIAMAGARPPHNILCANLTATLVPLARARGCMTTTIA
jgi:Uma2 family endonuclease